VAGSIHGLRIELGRMADALRGSVRERGLAATGAKVAVAATGQLTLPITRARRRDERFEFAGERLPYTMVRYNNSFLNERIVEVSVAKWFLARGTTGRMLEVGNVLAHYGITGHTVLDKYEVIPGIINDDIVGYVPDEPFDTVVAISTLEHVGWDEEPRHPDKVLAAVDAIRNCSRGRVLVTIPIGYNQRLDEGLRSGEVKFPVEHWLVRLNRRNDWAESDKDDALGRAYGRPHPSANGLYVGIME
jgi:hypothetical protein